MSENLTLEKLQIHERLQTLEAIITKHTSKVDIVMEQLGKITDCHEKMINGDGNGNVGLRGKVLLLENSESRRVWTLRAMWGAIIVLIVDTVKGLFFNK